MADIKQVIVIRKDLNMRKGKIAAQVAHAAMKVFFDKMQIIESADVFTSRCPMAIISHLTPSMIHWMQGAFTKVVVSVNSEEEIYELARRATDLNIPHAVIIDNGLTEFRGNKTTTAIAIGPEKSDKIDQLTAGLPLI